MGLKKRSPARNRLRLLPGLLCLGRFDAIEISRQLFRLDRAECLFQKAARFFALRACKTVRLDAGRTVGSDDDIDRFQAAPPTFKVSLTLPSTSGCSITE